MSVSTELVMRAHAAQANTVTKLNELPDVDAGPLDVVTHELCDVDTNHGPGTCFFLGTNGRCLTCTIKTLRGPRSWRVAVDVLL